MSGRRVCKEAGENATHTKRPAPHAGPRCSTCHRAVKAGRRDAAWAKRLWDTYHITPERYWELYKAQGGCCYVCRRATGKVRRLSVDHDHACCDGPVSCGACVRGLLCSVDNKWLGHIRDDPAAAERAAEYLINPPGRRV